MQSIKLILCLLCSLLFCTNNLKAQVTDADIKVAYIYRFTEYIEWPENSDLNNFTIGVFDNNELMLNKLRYLANNRKIQKQKIDIIQVSNLQELTSNNLHVLYVGDSFNKDIIDIFSAIKEKSTLLITNNNETKESLMINFLPSEKEGIVRFEVNKKNVNDEGLIIKPDILLLGGTYIDVRKLFHEKEQELEAEKDKLKKSKQEVAKQQKIIELQDITISQKELVIENKDSKIKAQNTELESQRQQLKNQQESLHKLLLEIEEKQQLLKAKTRILDNQEKQIQQQNTDINTTKLELDKQLEKLTVQEQQIASQEKVLFEQMTQIQMQRNLLLGFVAIILLVVSLAYFVYRSFRIKKKANIQLEKYNKEIEAANLELEKLSIVASKTNNAVLIATKDAEIEWVNEGFTRLFGYKYEDLVHKYGKNLISEFSNKLVEQKLQECRNSKETVEYLALNNAKDGKQLWMHTSLTPILDEQGEIKKLIIIEANVTELKIAEENIKKQKEEIEEQNAELENYRNHLETLVNKRTEELLAAKEKAEESDRLKSSFIANMSHEIRTPMNAVLGFSRMLTSRTLPPEKSSEYVNIINSNAKSLMRLIDDLIDLAAMEAGNLFIKKAPFDTHIMLNELYLIYKEKLKAENPNIKLKLNLHLTDEKFIIRSDRLRINQVFINLLNNALKFTPEGTIEFGYNLMNSDAIQFYVADTGIGIEKEKQQFIFERFSKIESNKNKLYRGAGLGLSICKSIVTALKGTIGVESKVGEGSIFSFILNTNNSDKLKPSTKLLSQKKPV